MSGAADYSRIRIVETSDIVPAPRMESGEQQEIRLSKRSVMSVLNG